MLRTQISLTPEARALLDAEAQRSGRSLSALIRDAVEQAYGPRLDADADIRAIEAALGAWDDREVDGHEYVERLRSASRLSGTA